ncbi:NBN protein, partial [Rhinopomastus cyanomelas]|nr:NBN protein [Rhinopomastus cyanomelas]
MWKLVPATGKGETYRLLNGTNYVVGRKNCSILIQDDQSISRSHAVLTVSRPETTHSQSFSVPLLTVTDTSKYGTFVNGTKLNGTSVSLQSGDRINFGVFESKFRVEYEPLVVCSSCLDAAQKTALNQAIHQLGGLVVNEWTKECTHLVMVSVKVTVKTICALICGRPIIKPEFFVELIKAIQSRQQLPNHERQVSCFQNHRIKFIFCPPVDEPSIGTEKLDLSEHLERKTIFRGKTFVFLTAKQHKKLGSAVVLGGGEAKLMMEGRKEMSLIVSPDVCVVDAGLTNSQVPGSDSMRNWTDAILTVLQSNNLRAIPEAEIGLAVIFMSTEKYCNPQKEPGNRAVSRRDPGSALAGRAISESLAVDETIMATAADNSSVFVADTEIEENTCMEIENTPQMDRQEKMAFQDITAVKKNPNTSGSVNAGAAISRVNRTSGFSQKSHPVSPSKVSPAGKPGESASRHQSNSITNYFQVARKRERAEEEETPVSKLAKLEGRSSPVPKCAEPTASSVRGSEVEQHQNAKIPNPNFALEDLSVKILGKSVKLASDNTDTRTTSSENHALKKRKELDDLSEDPETLETVFGSRDLDWEDEMVDHVQETPEKPCKKRCLEAKGSRIPDVNVKQKEGYKILKEEELRSGPTSEMKSEFKQESPVSVRNQLINHDDLQDDSKNLPSRLLLIEFRSLVVSHARQNSQLTVNTSCGGKKNFKLFKKVAYPGEGQLPYIIGGSDLIAHHAKKNSELEDWLRQEMEEQNRQTREESLADDLFRYDPNVKRRR